MSDDEVIRFEITDYDLDNEFNINRRGKAKKEQQIYGLYILKHYYTSITYKRSLALCMLHVLIITIYHLTHSVITSWVGG